jgi:hypothetical protein
MSDFRIPHTSPLARAAGYRAHGSAGPHPRSATLGHAGSASKTSRWPMPQTAWGRFGQRRWPEHSVQRILGLRHVKNNRQLLSGRGRRHRRAEREVILSAIDQAQAGGARLLQACRIVGISALTIERWRDRPEGDDARHGPNHRPHNALSPAEESQIMTVPTSFPVRRAVAQATGAAAC